MELTGKRYILHGSRKDEFSIWNIADIHYGNKGCAVDRLKRDLQQLADDPFSFWVGGGDYAEYISYSDRRFDPSVVSDEISVADLGKLGKVLTGRIRDFFWPIKDKCLGLAFGNHEYYYLRQKEQEELHAWLCTELDVVNLAYSGFFDLVFVRASGVKKPRLVPSKAVPKGRARVAVRFYVHHGAGYARTEGGKLNRLVEFMQGTLADVIMVGHLHSENKERLVRHGADETCTSPRQEVQFGAMTGAYLKTYQQGVTTYAEMRGYRAVPLGPVKVRIRPETREIE